MTVEHPIDPFRTHLKFKDDGMKFEFPDKCRNIFSVVCVRLEKSIGIAILVLSISTVCGVHLYAAEHTKVSSEQTVNTQGTDTLQTTPEPELEEVKVSTSLADAVRFSTTSKVVVDRKEIERYGDNSLAKLLNRLPGLSIDNQPGRITVRMKGLGNGYTQILINGDPVPNGFSIDSISPDMIERIEVLKLPTADSNAQAISGSINLILKQAGKKASREFNLNVSSEQDNPSLLLGAQLSEDIEKISYLLSGSVGREDVSRPSTIYETGRNTDGLEVLSRATQRESDNRTDSIIMLGNTRYALANDGLLTIDGLFNYRSIDGSTSDRSETSLGDLPDYSGNNVRFGSTTSLLQTKINLQLRPSEYSQMNTEFGLRSNRRDSDVSFIGLDQQDNITLQREVPSGSSDLELTFNGKYSLPTGESHSFVLGWQAQASRREEERVQNDTTFDGRPEIDLNESYDAQIRRLGIYIQDEWTLHERWSAYFGLRCEGIDTRSRSKSFFDISNRDTLMSPIFQTVWGVPGIKSDQIRFGISRTYKTPQLVELIPRRFISNNNSPTSPDTEGNPMLQPERAWGIDMAYERLFVNGILSASVYARQIDDVILQELANVEGLWVSRPINNGSADVYGIGIETKFDIRKILPTLPSIDFKLSLDRNWSRVSAVQGPKNTLDRQQPLTINAALDYKLAATPITLGGNFSFSGAKTARISETQVSYLGIKRVLDFYATWRLSPDTNIRFVLANLLHQHSDASALFFNSDGLLDQTTRTPTQTNFRIIVSHRF
jgi:outer membrane receptor for ferrienterochelin and colicins